MARKGPRIHEKTRLAVEDIDGFFEKTVTKIGTGAKIDCPKRYLGRSVYVVIRKEGPGTGSEEGETPPVGKPAGRRSHQPGLSR